MTVISDCLKPLQDIIVDDVRATYFKSVLSRDRITYIPFENEEILETEEEVVTILTMLTKIRFGFDLNLVSTISEIQTFFDTEIRNDVSNIKIRTVLNWVNGLYIRIGFEKWVGLVSELTDAYSFNSSLQIDPTYTCYDQFILNGGIVFNTDEEKPNLFENNPWLVIVGLIRFIPASVIVSLTQPETMDKWQ